MLTGQLLSNLPVQPDVSFCRTLRRLRPIYYNIGLLVARKPGFTVRNKVLIKTSHINNNNDVIIIIIIIIIIIMIIMIIIIKNNNNI